MVKIKETNKNAMIKIYHNPRCSKSRQTLALLEELGEQPEVILYLKNPPSAKEIAILCDQLGLEPKQLIRNKESRFAELQLNLDDQISNDQWCSILAANPILIERPIVVSGNRACLGRPPENIHSLL